MKRYRVLIVMTQETVRTMLQIYLAAQSFTVVLVASVADGAAEIHQTLPDVLVVEKALPDADGEQWSATLRHQLNYPLPAVCMLTPAEYQRRYPIIIGERIGANEEAYFSENFDVEELRLRLINLTWGRAIPVQHPLTHLPTHLPPRLPKIEQYQHYTSYRFQLQYWYAYEELYGQAQGYVFLLAFADWLTAFMHQHGTADDRLVHTYLTDFQIVTFVAEADLLLKTLEAAFAQWVLPFYRELDQERYSLDDVHQIPLMKMVMRSSFSETRP